MSSDRGAYLGEVVHKDPSHKPNHDRRVLVELDNTPCDGHVEDIDGQMPFFAVSVQATAWGFLASTTSGDQLG